MTIKQIYNQLIAAKNNQPDLALLLPINDNADQLLTDLQNNTSRVQVWRMLLWIQAFGMWLQRQVFDNHKKEVAVLASAGHYGTVPWWHAKTLSFIFGGSPLAGVAAISEAANQVVVKAVKASGSTFIPFTPEEREAMLDYLTEMKPAGTTLEIISAPADLLRLDIDVIFDAKQGLSVIRPLVQNSVRNYLVNLDFNGIFRITDLKAAVLAVNGVVDVRVNAVQAKNDLTVFLPVSRIYQTFAGWMILDPSTPINNQIKLSAGNV
jgi:hypothetical protein